MTTTQIYELVNQITAEALGTNEIATVDAQGLVSLGSTVLSSTTNTEAFLNTMIQRIARTIISYRGYTNKLRDMVLSDFDFGAIVQKLKTDMPMAEESSEYELVDGQSIDQYKVAKPKTHQKLFVTRSPYNFHVTTPLNLLKEAFLSEQAMGSYLSSVYGEVRNKIELSLENLGRTCLNNFAAEVAGGAREIKLVTLYNTETALEVPLTAETTMYDPAFLRFAVATINQYSNYFTDMSDLYNDGTTTRHTPKEMQRLKVLSDFERKLETVVQYDAFHKELVSLNAYVEMNFWQSSKSRSKIMVTRSSDGTETTVENVVAMLYDRDALGTYKQEEETLTTPVNAAGKYYNTFWHAKQLWFNDLSENYLLFTLN